MGTDYEVVDKIRVGLEAPGFHIYEEDATTSPRLKALILEVLENQLRENDPPETREMLERLLAVGYLRQEPMNDLRKGHGERGRTTK